MSCALFTIADDSKCSLFFSQLSSCLYTTIETGSQGLASRWRLTWQKSMHPWGRITSSTTMRLVRFTSNTRVYCDSLRSSVFREVRLSIQLRMSGNCCKKKRKKRSRIKIKKKKWKKMLYVIIKLNDLRCAGPPPSYEDWQWIHGTERKLILKCTISRQNEITTWE